MTRTMTRLSALALVTVLAACGSGGGKSERMYLAQPRVSQADLHPNETPELRALIRKYSALYGVPEDLVHRVVIRESRHRPGARNGRYYGLMQMAPATARELVEGRRVHTQELVVSLRNFIREALDLDPVPTSLPIPPQGPARPATGAGSRNRGEGGGSGRGGGGGMGEGGMGGGGMGGGMGMGLGTDRHDPDP